MSKWFSGLPGHCSQVRHAWLSYLLGQRAMLSNFKLLVIKIRALCLIFLKVSC